MPIPDHLFAEMPRLSDSALRALLAMTHLSFRYDPEAGQWVKPERTFSRADVQAECTLSSQGTRNGLDELEEAGYVGVDRSGQSYEHELKMGVPSSRFTYVPTDLFEEASSLSGPELRLVLAVLRATWGWTTDLPETAAPEHRRWAQLSTRALSELTGRSGTSVKKAAQKLQGTWLRRRRPTSGTYHYRFRSEVLTTETAPEQGGSTPGEVAVQKRQKAVFSMGLPNDLPPDRQQSDPPRRGRIERRLETSAKHTATPERADRTQENSPSPSGRSAVREGKSPRERPGGSDRSEESSIDLTGFSDRKRELGQKLVNVGVWPRRIPELLGRFSTERIEANFELFRKRAPGVRDGGAWLTAAIEGGFALPSPSESDVETTSSTETSAEGRADTLPAPGTKVSETRRRALLEAGLATEADFDRFADYDDPGQKQHFFRVDKTPPRARSSPASRR
jgi:hypothetical protein